MRGRWWKWGLGLIIAHGISVAAMADAPPPGREGWGEDGPGDGAGGVGSARGSHSGHRKKDHEDHKRIPVEGPPRERPYDPEDVTSYGELRKDLNGPYEQGLQDPRPDYRTHKPHTYGSPQGPHPYEFSLSFGFWMNRQSGSVSASSDTGSGEGKLVQDDRTTYLLSINNPRAGFGVTQIKHVQGVDGTFRFNGVDFNATGSATFDSNFVLYDSFYRWCLIEWEDFWLDYLLGIKVVDGNVRVQDVNAITEVNAIAPLAQAGVMWRRQFAQQLFWRGFLKGAGGGFSGNSGTVFDLETEFVYVFPGDREYSRFNQFSVGYKVLDLSFTTTDDADNETEATVSAYGPFVSFSAYF